MNNRYVLGVRFGEDRPVGPQDSYSSREVEKFDDLRRSQILSVRKACDKFLESRGLKQMPFGTLFEKDEDRAARELREKVNRPRTMFA